MKSRASCMLGVILFAGACRGDGGRANAETKSNGRADESSASRAPDEPLTRTREGAASATTGASAPRPTAASDTASASGAPSARACAADMQLVAGAYCPDVEQKCTAHTKDYEQQEKRREQAKAAGQAFDERAAPERCTHFAEPSRCLSRARRPMRFCMDTYEWPNRAGELPALLVTWAQADKACKGAGKRLCSADEFNFACEGEDLRPYSYGYVRDAARCNVDKPYVQPNPKLLLPFDLCEANARCRAHIHELDQREPAGARPGCVSPFGIFDLNGNVNEWVERPGQTAPRRSGLKGGWWGPARSRCRPMVTAHDENYVGYEVGFRCCADAAPEAAP